MQHNSQSENPGNDEQRHRGARRAGQRRVGDGEDEREHGGGAEEQQRAPHGADRDDDGQLRWNPASEMDNSEILIFIIG
jgi:hypothetical protein